MIKTFGWICYGIGLFIMLACSGIWPAVISILIAGHVEFTERATVKEQEQWKKV